MKSISESSDKKMRAINISSRVPFENVELAAGSVQSEVQPFLQESNPAIANPIKVFLHRFCRNMKGFGLERPGLQDKDCSKSYLSLCIGEGKILFQN